jgi:hypothetical protein
MRARHPKKEVEAALRDAEDAGFTVLTGRAHWGILQCPGDQEDHCRSRSISGTPRNPSTHARQIRRFVTRCPHK